MNEKNREILFREQCKEYLKGLSLMDLRGYGRFLNLTAPTKLKKSELIFEIIEILSGKKVSARTKKGAPIKNDYFKVEIPFKIEEIRRRIWGTVNQNRKEKNGVQVQFSVDIGNLTKEQRQLLNEFLNSL